MALDNHQKIKLLKLWELLQQDTDEEHPLTTSALLDRLEGMGIACDRRTLSKDMAALDEQGYEVLRCHVGHEKAYYVEDRSFSLPEIRILLDAVQAASFITPKKTAELVGKIAALGGSHRAELLTGSLVHFATRKHSNESIYYNIDALQQALQQRRKALFRYYDLDADGSRVYRRDGHHYVAEPIALVFNEDNYYLVSYSAKHDSTTNYRVDRMSGVEVLDDFVCQKALRLRQGMSDYADQSIKMYSGEPVSVTLLFPRVLIGALYDRFGEATRLYPCADDRFTATVCVQLSPTFFGWLFQFAGQMKILSPDAAVRQYKEMAQSLLNA